MRRNKGQERIKVKQSKVNMIFCCFCFSKKTKIIKQNTKERTMSYFGFLVLKYHIRQRKLSKQGFHKSSQECGGRSKT
jgi:hypothetical protein